MSSRPDSNMTAKMRKVRQYDIIARRERVSMDTIQDGRQRARHKKQQAKYELVYMSGRVERFLTYDAMLARRDSRAQSVVYTRDLYPRPYDVQPPERDYYVVKLKSGRYVMLYFEDDAVERFSQEDAVSLRYFPSLRIIYK